MNFQTARELELTAGTRGQELQFQMLGQLAVHADSEEIALGSPKQRAVLAVLLLHANDVVPVDRIIDSVWGDDPPRTAEHSVQIYISELRKSLSNGSSSNLIVTRPPGYVINVPPETLDISRFEKLVRDGLSAIRANDLSLGKRKLEAALENWNGDPLGDFAYEEFAQGYIRSLTELRSDALEALADVELQHADHDAARRLASQAIDVAPLREEPRRIMMLALYRSGRQADALRHFGEFQAVLGEELGIEPSESIRLLEEQVLLHDPLLDIREVPSTRGNPYRGLRAFSEDDAAVYFGRESLIEEVLHRLESGPGFVSIVGPSGSGKSSAARAGVVAELRDRGDTVVVFQPGARPLWELAGALDNAGLGTRASILRRMEDDSQVLTDLVNRRVVVVIDQFEELFTLAEHDVAIRFSELISTAVRDESTPLSVVATLRADYYDKPLSMPALAGVFTDSVVSVRPMTAREIERAVVEPAKAAGVSVEPALLTQVVADMGDEPGALPLLQFTLFELFDKTSNGLKLADYEELGGINGALTGGADELLGELDAEGQGVVEQLMMRMIQKGRALSTSRPVPVRDLLDLGVDKVILQEVLEAFGARRLITFDRDASGSAVVEIAHEYLLSEWPQMETWITDHSGDLDHLYALDNAASEWRGSGKSEDYLLRGGRLDQFEQWRSETTLKLTSTETQFVDASVEMRRRDDRARAEQQEKEASLQTQARRRLWYFGGAVAALAAAVTILVVTLIPEPPPDVVASYCCRDSASAFGDNIAAGLDAGLEGTGLVLAEVGTTPGDHDVLADYARSGTSFILTDGVFAYERAAVLMEENPDLVFGYLECAGQPLEAEPNLWCVTPANQEMGFLAGAAAGLATETNHVGIVLGAQTYSLPAFQAGFEQGVRSTNPTAEIDAVYLGSIWPYSDLSGFESPNLGLTAALTMYGRGADVIFAAAGFSNKGVHEAALEYSERTDRHVWSIGADDDEWQFYNTEWWWEFSDESDIAYLTEHSARIQEHILTSVEKRTDVGLALLIEAYLLGESDVHVDLNMANDGFSYSISGGHLASFQPHLDSIITDLANGEIVVGSVPGEDAPLLWDWLSEES